LSHTVGHHRRLWGALAVVVTSCILAVTTGGCGGPALDPGIARVIKVVDGDTLEVEVDTGRERVRLLGIDTPETVHPTKPVECFGPEASARMKQLAPPGTELRLERDTELRDRFGRLLAYAFLADGTFINRSMVTDGFATTLPIDPNRAYRQDLSAAESEARDQGRGLWSACP
jgi:micrococcal nuclease